MNLKKSIIRNIINIPGWTTKRKIVVFESDDWGSIRMSSVKNRNSLLKKGFNLDENIYTRFDALESNADLTCLFELLSKYRDFTGRCPVFTAVSIVGNPNFDEIKNDNFLHYHWEPFTETLKKYPEHDKVIELYNEGINKRLFVPVFHGREHLNVQRWLRKLQTGNKSLLIAFDCGITGINRGINGEYLGDFQAAFDLDYSADLNYQKDVIKEGLTTFRQLWGFDAEYFVATNGPFNNSLEKNLLEGGVRYILGERYQKEPLGDGKYSIHFRYIGLKNKLGQTYLTRNGFFEPSSSGKLKNNQAVESCLKDIERAFRWRKPAIISSHRVNYIGFIDPANRDRSLKMLDELLTQILLKWPDVEFMTSIELGNLISTDND